LLLLPLKYTKTVKIMPPSLPGESRHGKKNYLAEPEKAGFDFFRAGHLSVNPPTNFKTGAMVMDSTSPPADYKNTLNLPQTRFPMKANLPQREPQMLDEWQQMDIYASIRRQSEGRPKYILHDGPPYANGRLHMGHVLNKVLKDIIIKSRQMSGLDAVYVPGWDCHGLPIEHEVDKKLGRAKADMTKAQIRQECRAYANKFIDVQRREFMRLGVFGDWFNPYLTMAYSYEAVIVAEFAEFYRRGAVYRSKKPIYWCNSCRTALAEAEVEYDNHTTPSIYAAFPFKDSLADLNPALAGLPLSAVIWTTTPWTIPSNLGIALHPEFAYGVYVYQGKGYLLADELAAGCLERFAMPGAERLCSLDPKALEGRKVRHPFYERDSLLVLAGYVTLEAGTGLVHTSPGHGREDYETGIKYGLDIYAPLDDGGRYTEEVDFFAGQEVFAANPLIIDKLREVGALLARDDLDHSYPHCWRCKKPVIFRATPQWFISMEATGLRRKALDAIENEVTWLPRWGKERIYGMIENRPDWCISRQRYWGVPITVFKCGQCQEAVLTQAMAEKIVAAFHEAGADAWFTRGPEELLGRELCQCPHCGSPALNKEEDILDVWFDSGVSQAAVLARREDLAWPADLYLEGSDQHRGYFHSSLLCAVGTRDRAPYKTVLTHGFVVDGSGRKMSKSLGNVIMPEDMEKRYGADILRLWVAAEDYTDPDVRLSDSLMGQLSEAYRRIRNTMRFLLGNLNDFDPEKHLLPAAELSPMDRFMLHRLEELKIRLAKAYEDMAFHVIYHSLQNFCVADLSGFYMDVSKDILYTLAYDSPRRRGVQTVLYHLADTLVRLMAPVLAFTAEEIWKFLPGRKHPSVHLAAFAAPEPQWLNPELAETWQRLLGLRAEVNKALDVARKEKILGNSLDAHLLLSAPGLREFISANLKTLEEICMVSQIEVLPHLDSFTWRSQEIEGLELKLIPSSLPKCPRCWKRRPEMAGADLCPDCRQAVSRQPS
jgi:isoleucyl-tRNA synthetase